MPSRATMPTLLRTARHRSRCRAQLESGAAAGSLERVGGRCPPAMYCGCRRLPSKWNSTLLAQRLGVPWQRTESRAPRCRWQPMQRSDLSRCAARDRAARACDPRSAAAQRRNPCRRRRPPAPSDASAAGRRRRASAAGGGASPPTPRSTTSCSPDDDLALDRRSHRSAGQRQLMTLNSSAGPGRPLRRRAAATGAAAPDPRW